MRRLLSLLLLISLTLTTPIFAQEDDLTTVNQTILDTLNQIRTSIHGQQRLEQDLVLNAVARVLLETFEDDCSFFEGDDLTLAQQAGYTGNIRPIRSCGINLPLGEVTGLFSNAQSETTNLPLIAGSNWRAIGIAGERRQTPGGPQDFFVLVLGETVLNPVPNVVIPQSFGSTYEAATLGFTFNYPDGWLVDNSDAVTLLASRSDLPAATDGDPGTSASNLFISLDALMLADLGVTSGVRMDDVQQLVVQALGFQIQQQVETPVMARRAITLMGMDANGDFGLVTFWVQDEQLVLFIMSAPQPDILPALLAPWQRILETVTPMGALPLTQPVYSDFMALNFMAPEGWTVFNGADRFGLFELSSDRDLYVVGSDAFFSGRVVTALYQSADQLLQAGILEEQTLEALLELNIDFLGLNNVEVSEGWVLDEPALIVKSVNSGNFWSYGVMGYTQDIVYFIQVSSPTEAAVDEFQPTFHEMMQNLSR
jgi:hypothetical protein